MEIFVYYFLKSVSDIRFIEIDNYWLKLSYLIKYLI